MLKLTNIKKDYATGNEVVHALKGVSLEFRESEFVSILGQSGCGKTTLLNIIGGLDKYSDGDLEINGKSTKEFTDRDWDTYRNHSVGFIFQSYNLIPHQTVLSNVELALTLAGVSSSERKARAKAALEKVGLGDQLHKKPNQMSGGQMQRVAIARALVNDPEILLADEPTGALDSETSVQIMDLIKEISKDRLVIMVTHNPELANEYSTRIINLLDGLVISDSNPYNSIIEAIAINENIEESVENAPLIAEEATKAETKAESTPKSNTPSKKKATNKGKKKQTSMSFFTAFILSLNNLLTKKSRTILTAFAGSIGIIGIALIFAVSNGTNSYINSVQESTLSSYPLTIQGETVDIGSLMITLLSGGEDGTDAEKENRDPNAVYKDPLIASLVEEISKIEVNKNDLASFKKELDKQLKDEDSDLYKAVSEVQYKYPLNLSVYTRNDKGDIIKSDTNVLLQEMMAEYFIQSGLMSESESSSMFGDTSSSMSMSSMMSGSITMWQELLADSKNGKPVSDVVTNQYDVIYGTWPNDYNEVVIVVDEDNEIDDLTLYALGLLGKDDIDKIIKYAAEKKPLPEEEIPSWSFKEVCGQTYKVILPSDFYTVYGDTVIDNSSNETHLQTIYDNALELKVSGIIRLKDSVDSGYMSGYIGYTSELTKHVIKESTASAVAQLQAKDKNFDILSKLPFESTSKSLSDIEKKEIFTEYVSRLSTSNKAKLFLEISYFNAYSAPTDNPFTPGVVETTPALDFYMSMILSNVKDQKSAVDFLTTAILSAVSEDELEGLISAVKLQYEQETKQSFELLPEDKKQELYKEALATQYKLNTYSYENLMKIITPMAEAGAKAQIQDATKKALDISLPTNESKASALLLHINGLNDKDYGVYYDNFMKFSDSTYEENLVKFGMIDMGTPSSINIYTSTFKQKDDFKDFVKAYNAKVGEDSGKQIEYSDILGDMMSAITTIINAITYVLIAFVATSLVVSSIMIGVITLISVQERTKEIGVLRAMGASKRDISRVFNAETMIVGLVSGILGISVTIVLSWIINIIIHALTGVEGLKAAVGFWPAVILIIISMVLTLIAGLIPSRVAAKKDPVIALRTE